MDTLWTVSSFWENQLWLVGWWEHFPFFTARTASGSSLWAEETGGTNELLLEARLVLAGDKWAAACRRAGVWCQRPLGTDYCFQEDEKINLKTATCSSCCFTGQLWHLLYLRGGRPTAHGHPGSTRGRGHGIQGLVPEGALSLALHWLNSSSFPHMYFVMGGRRQKQGKLSS